MVKPTLSRFFAALISISLMFATTPSFAAMDCCDPIAMATQMADMAHHQGGADQQKQMPCKMPAGQCASICIGMTSMAMPAGEVASMAPAAIGEPIWNASTYPSGISQPPALPPPIRLA